MVFPELKTDPRVQYLDYTWLISGIFYEGGTDKLVPELMKRGINEVYFYNVAGTMIGQKTVAGVSTRSQVSLSLVTGSDATVAIREVFHATGEVN